METTEAVTEARFTIRAHMGRTPIYTESIAHVYDYIRAAVPNVNIDHGALFTFAIGIFMLTAEECDTMCVHQAGKNIAALADRMLIDREWDKRVRT
ncbi:hypothetical protein [Saccharopolyspora hattusasensis]|uniref:hypothetical protein n=1 Tax=Saccharopolyspora hattusasensis TaxID=1128679 RepID=UPI003D97E9A3